MTGHHSFANLTKDFGANRKAKIAAKTAQLKEEMALNELRQALKISQAELAEKLQGFTYAVPDEVEK
jgi:DNA-binding transcriptional regulator YiaG